MTVETFSSEREFNKKFPSKMYVCCFCKKLTPNPTICPHCNGTTNILFPLDTYSYKIADKETKTIFKPLEIVNPYLTISKTDSL